MNHHPPSDERDPPRKDEEAPRPESREEANEPASPVCYANAPELRAEFREDEAEAERAAGTG